MIALPNPKRASYLSPHCRHKGKLKKSPPGTPVYFFYDFSNIGIGAQHVASRNGDGLITSDVRVHCENLRRFVERDRFWGGGYAAAGITGDPIRIQRRFASVDVRLDVFERGIRTGSEQAVDQAIQNQIYRLLAVDAQPGVVVLASGDGNGHSSDEGFLPPLRLLHRHGFDIEIMSWEHSLNLALENWASEHGTLVYLDDWYKELTFVPHRRSAKSTSQVNRRLARALFS